MMIAPPSARWPLQAAGALRRPETPRRSVGRSWRRYCSSRNVPAIQDAATGQDPTLRRGRAREYAVDLGGHDEVVLMQSLDLLGLQRDYRVAPTEADIRMMAFSFREFTNLLNKGKRLPEIAKPEAPLDAVSFLRQLPVWGLRLKELTYMNLLGYL
jgi:hypothetical protein